MTHPKTVAIVQARHSASRFPGKVLTKVAGKTLLEWLIGQLRKATRLDQIVLATTGSPADDDIASFARSLGLTVYRGSERDVLDRYYRAANLAQASTVVRVTADCPLLDPVVVDLVVDAFFKNPCDYAANTAPPPGKFPDGMDVEVFSMEALQQIWEESRAADEREHVTFALWKNPERFRIHQVDWQEDWSDVRATVDYPEDLDAIRAVLDSSPDGIPPVARVVEILREHYRDASRGHTQGEGWSAKPRDLTSGQPAPPLATALGDALFEQAARLIPGGAQTFSKTPLQYVKGTAPQVLVRGNGSKVWDADGNEFLDYVLGLGPAILGHCHPQVNLAAAECASDTFLTPSLPHPLEAQLAHTICRLLPSAEMVRFGKNGSDVTAGAARIARAVTGRDVIACSGYHGWQDWYIGSTTRNLGVPDSTSDLTHAFPYGDLLALEDLLHVGDVAGVILEPVSLTAPPSGYLEGVRDLCTKYGALLIFDEIITGFRIHLGGAQTVYGVTPDLTTLGKGIANGLPLAVLCGKAEYMAVLQEAFFSFTFGGELPSIAAAIKTIEVMEREGTPTQLSALGRRLREGVDQVSRTSGCAVLSSIGLDYFPGYSLKATDENSALELQTLFQQELVRRGILTRACFFISTAHSTYDIDRTLSALLGAARVLQTAITEGSVLERIDGDLIEPVFRAAEKVN
ncbi:MAG: glutamate-1-semialdehyde aminotransferase [Planctomycetota bacterium]